MSKLNTFSDGFKVLRIDRETLRDYKPFAFFGWLGLICFAIATAFFAAGAQRLSGNRHGAEVPDSDRVFRALCDFVPVVDQWCDSGGYYEETPSVI